MTVRHYAGVQVIADVGAGGTHTKIGFKVKPELETQRNG